ncbi:Seripauperin and TIP1 family-domain-containing protein [Scheffersomyces amazonensis]|uniref:Seripauperin and TIP1 family-domain-containing protein n=1 Tax=Scheffersomyces amazonensis TaxID=1078765 RepID=UPI00315D1893
MQFISLIIVSISFILQFSSAADLDSSELAFLTRFVGDAKSHLPDYIGYLQTATVSVPTGLTALAIQVQTYTNDAYTTLLSEAGINVSQLESFATGLPWYSSRLAGNGNNVATTSATTTSNTSSTVSSTSSSSIKTSSSSKSSSSITTVKTSKTSKTSKTTTTTTNSDSASSVNSASIVAPPTTSSKAGGSSGFAQGSFLASVAGIVVLLL